MVLLMMGRDDLLLSASLNKPAVPSDIDVFSWRNHGSLRVRYNGRSGILKLLPPSPAPTGLAPSAHCPSSPPPRAGTFPFARLDEPKSTLRGT